jgi:hypothetical protein
LVKRAAGRHGSAPNTRRAAPFHPKIKAARYGVARDVANFQIFEPKKMARVLLNTEGKKGDLCTDAQTL